MWAIIAIIAAIKNIAILSRYFPPGESAKVAVSNWSLEGSTIGLSGGYRGGVPGVGTPPSKLNMNIINV